MSRLTSTEGSEIVDKNKTCVLETNIARVSFGHGMNPAPQPLTHVYFNGIRMTITRGHEPKGAWRMEGDWGIWLRKEENIIYIISTNSGRAPRK